MRDYSEKRDFIRMQVDTDIEIRLPSTPERLLQGVCEDLSATGMSVLVTEELPMGVEVSTKVPSHNPDFPPFETLARIIRCDTVADGRFSLGLEILKVLQ
ncbi:MAG: PilZ domain-containing protein [Halomonadaceae bacterium]|nr:MAG: PilZ domain-containing protein [Halomonadaceae bacterium]